MICSRQCRWFKLSRFVPCLGINYYFIKCISVLYGLTYLIILPLICVDLQHSVYFIKPKNLLPMQTNMKKWNVERVENSKKYLQLFRKNTVSNFALNQTFSSDVVIGIISKSRDGFVGKTANPQYLTQSVASFLKILNDPHNEIKLKLQIFICNVDPEPSSFTEAQNISNFVTMVTHYLNRSAPSYGSILKKERIDYAFCLTKGVKFGGKYILLVEDDTLPMKDMFNVLEHTIFHCIEKGISRGESRGVMNDLAFVKFYHPHRVNNYAGLECQRWSEWIGLSILLSSLSTYVAFRLWQPKTFSANQLWFWLFVYYLLLLLSIGRPYVLEIRRLLSPHFFIFAPSPSCCTPAMLYPRFSALEIADYMLNPSLALKIAKDNVLDKFLSEKKRRAFIVEPNTFTHIGLISTLRGMDKALLDPYIVD